MVHHSKVRAAGSHLKEQALRFGRLFGMTFVAQLAPLGFSHLDRTVLISAAVGAAEALVRQWANVVPAKDVAVPINPAAKTAPASEVFAAGGGPID
jgi:NADPH-dependent curcumin reductase CurA